MPAPSKRARVEDSPSEQEILRLVAQRDAARQARRFDEADEVREHLRSLGIELYDKDKEWRSKDGRRGSMFTAAPVECRLSDAEVQARVQDREDARKAKDWDLADKLREDLRDDGVELNDREMCWRTSGGRTGTYTGSPTASQMTGSAIRKMVAERERHRAAHDFDSADAIRQELQSLGVELYDNERLWRCSDGRQGFIITGGAEVNCTLKDAEIQSQVAQREEMRSHKEWDRADAIRDELRRLGCELLDKEKMWCTTDGRSGSYSGGSTVHQSHSLAPSVKSHASSRETTVALAQAAAALALKQNSAGGGSGPSLRSLSAIGGRGGGHSQPLSPHSGGGGGPFASNIVETWSEASIKALIAGRERAREMHDWAAADAIRADLRSHGVEVWDKEKIWKAHDGRHGVIER